MAGETEELPLFGADAARGETAGAGGLDVARLSFERAETLTWRELFEGFDSLRAITYSSGVGFVCELVGMFEDAEVIFGSEEVMSFSLQEVMAYQCKLLERLREGAGKARVDLAARVGAGTLRLFVARGRLSHEKVYLLAAKDGRRRVVMGSANLSFAAFGGLQRENIACLDGEAAYAWYLAGYERLREASTDRIGREALALGDAEANLEALPIAGTVKVRKALVVETVPEAREEVRFMLDVRNLAAKLAPAVPKPDKKGRLVLSPEKVKIVRRQVMEDRAKEREVRSEYPQLEVFVDAGEARLNDVPLDLAPPAEAVAHDVALFLRYMDGYEKFHGDVSGMQRRYFEFANWFFCSPFMAAMRDMATRHNQNLLPYPVFGLVYGQSKAGKTSFLETLLKMMIGQKTKISAPEFTRSSIEGLKRTVKGAPIIVDDLTNTRFNQHAIETIKNDDFGVSDRLLHYPAVVISANEDVKAVAPEVIRRTVICRVQAGLTNTEVMRSSVVRTVQREVGTALYREYLRRMLEVAADLLERMKDDASESAPDILAASSRVLGDLFAAHAPGPLPPYVRPLTLDDYFSEKVTGSYAIKTIRDAWATSRASFDVSPRFNRLQYDAGATWEADRILKELPETLEAHKSRNWVVMNLDAARAFFEIPFGRSLLDRLLRR